MKIIPYFRKSNSAVYVRLRDGKDVDYKISTNLYIDPIHYDATVPGYSKESNVPQEVKDKFNRQLADILLLVGKVIFFADQKKNVCELSVELVLHFLRHIAFF